MSRLRVAPIVEGHGEERAVRNLLERIWTELLGGEYIEIARPIRRPRSKLLVEQELARAIELALLKLQQRASGDPALVLILVDADDALPCELGPRLSEITRRARADADVSCVVAHIEYETWFVTAAGSLQEHLELQPGESLPEDPEQARLGKGWVDRHFRGTRYTPTVDQPAMTAKMDLRQCRSRSPSFDKLCRELARRRNLGPRDG